MRKLLLLTSLLACLQINAQNDVSPWTYSVGIGTTYRFPNTYGPELNSILSSRSSYPQIATNFSLAVDYQMTEKITVGLNTWGLIYPKVETSFTAVTLAGVGGGVKSSFRLVNGERWLVAPFLGAGIYHTKSNISNNGFLVNRPPLFVPPGSDASVFGQIMYLDLGVQLWMQSTGLVHWGISGGLWTKLVGTDWKTSWGASVDALTPPTLSLLYLRLSLAFRQKE